VRDDFLSVLRDYQVIRAAPELQPQFIDWYPRLASEIRSYIRGTPRYEVQATVGVGNLPEITWIGIRRPDIAPSFKQGPYVVYLFSKDGSRVYLSLNQGVSQLTDVLALALATPIIAERSSRIRSLSRTAGSSFSDSPIFLEAGGKLGKAYAAGHIWGREYAASSMPPDAVLIEDLNAMLAIYDSLQKSDVDSIFAPPSATLHPTRRGRGLSVEYPRLYPVAGIHLSHKLLRALEDAASTLDDLVSSPNDITFSQDVKHPRQRISELIRLAASLGLVSIDADSVSLSALGRRYNRAGGDNPATVSNEQAALVREAILKTPKRSYTYHAIVTMCRLASYLAPISPASVRDAFAAELRAERLNGVTRTSWAEWTLKYSEQLELIENGRLTKVGKTFLSELAQDVFDTEVAFSALPATAFEPPARRKYTVGRAIDWSHGDLKPIDQEGWRVALERRSDEHRSLTDMVAVLAENAGFECDETGYADLWIGHDVLIEVKTLLTDDVTQTRAALAQLLHYRHIYRNELPDNAVLVAVFSRRPAGPQDDLVAFLLHNGIVAAWPEHGQFVGSTGSALRIPWLCKADSQ
jgi:hypothetical protein